MRPVSDDDRDWVVRVIRELWGYPVVAHGAVYYPHVLPGFVAVRGEERIGLITYRVEDDECEIITLNSLRPSAGIGTALIEAVKTAARDARCRRIWLITTNDNLSALRFYQKRGFALVAVHRNALDVSRKLKPAIREVGLDGIPLRDEIELEMILG